MELSKIQEKYELIEERSISDLGSKGYLLKHRKTNARVFLMENDDDNKVFYIGFRTPPTDSTGVPHIMEHSVLCGSEAFPLKDPFVELAKGSLNTFLNAMTYPDKTVYPVASCNDQDFKNLMHVYMDAVFHPNIYKHSEIFKQEGWHYELENEEDEITINGVVYNEMKGAFSSPDDMIDRHIFEILYPDTAYALESGGDPEVIPQLTYEDFIAFHQKFYHPSNSYIYLYGNCDMAERLSWLDEAYLSKYDAIDVDSELTLQEGFEEIKSFEFPYSVTADEPLEDNTYLAISWVVDTALNRELYLAFQILEYALLSTPGAVIKERLIKSGIGKDVDSSYENGIYQPYFSVMVKNSNAAQKQQFIDTVYEVLGEVVKNGIDKKALEAGINYFEFKFREADFSVYPKGLMYGLQCLDSWLYDEKDPFKHISATETIEFLKTKINTGYFENLIKQYLIDNKHGAVLVSEPKVGLNDEKDEALRKKLEEYKNSFTAEQIKALCEDTKSLKEYQEAEDTPEAMETLPVLAVSDIKKEIEPLIYEEICENDIKYLYHEIKTNGIGYLNVSFELDYLPQEFLDYAALLKTVFGIMSTENYHYSELTNEINRKCGGIGFGIGAVNSMNKEKKYRCSFDVTAKFLEDGVDFVFGMIEEILFSTKMEDYDRLYEIIMMLKSRMQMSMMGQGHLISAVRAQSYYSDTCSIQDRISGLGQYRFICDISENFESKREMLVDKMKKALSYILNRNMMIIDFAGSRDTLKQVKDRASEFVKLLSADKKEAEKWVFEHINKNEGFKSSSMVQYVAMAGNFTKAGLSYTGALKVLKTIMGYDYLWINARVKGGAYGCFSTFSRSGNSYFVSYRDPNLSETLDIYENASAYVESFTVSDRDMGKYIIGTISDMDIPLTPKMKASRSASCYFSGITEEMLQKERDEVLGCDVNAIRALAAHVKAVVDQKNICCIGADSKITENEGLFGKVENLL